MIEWWFGHIEGNATNPGDGLPYSRYLIWHPRDHVSQSVDRPAPATGSNTTNATWWAFV